MTLSRRSGYRLTQLECASHLNGNGNGNGNGKKANCSLRNVNMALGSGELQLFGLQYKQRERASEVDNGK